MIAEYIMGVENSGGVGCFNVGAGTKNLAGILVQPCPVILGVPVAASKAIIGPNILIQLLHHDLPFITRSKMMFADDCIMINSISYSSASRVAHEGKEQAPSHYIIG